MKYLLDANVIIALARNSNAAIVNRAAECDEGDLVTSAVAYAEVVLGSSGNLPPAIDDLAVLVEEVVVLDFDISAAQAYGRLPFKRGGYDRLIAAHALARNLIVVTDNEHDFKGIDGLKVENWANPT